jgi:glycosyltransferase involved in cell wall biosynthesis
VRSGAFGAGIGEFVEASEGGLKIILLAPNPPFRFAGGIRMKLVVFAQTPPPHHGQSYMVELLVRGLQSADYGIEIFHVNAQFATDSKDIGKFRIGKVFRLFGYWAKAVALRFRHGADNLYYVPTPPVKTPLYRDWVLLTLLRLFFRRVIFHWHATGLGEWIEKQPGWMRRLTQMALGRADLSISLGRFNERDAAIFRPRKSVLVPNGIPDPCPNFPEAQRAWRARLQERLAVWDTPDSLRHQGTVIVRVLYLSLCSREKGVFDAIEGVCQANRVCRSDHLPVEFQLTIAGPFVDTPTEEFFNRTLERLGNPTTIRHVGFVDADAKQKLLSETDIFCFPTFYYAESFGLVVLEAMAFGLPIVATKWRSVPDLFPANYPGLVDIQSPDEIAEALFQAGLRDDSDEFRKRFLDNYTLEKFLQNMAAAIHSAEAPAQ